MKDNFNFEKRLKEEQIKVLKKPSTIVLVLLAMFCIFMIIKGVLR